MNNQNLQTQFGIDRMSIQTIKGKYCVVYKKYTVVKEFNSLQMAEEYLNDLKLNPRIVL